MSIQKIDDEKLLSAKRYHITQPDIPEMSADEMKGFMDYVPREVIIPKINEIIDGVNESLGLDDTGDERNFITPATGVRFYGGFYFNATAEALTEAGLYSSGTEYHLMDVVLENGSIKPIYVRSNYSGSYSVHSDLWTWNTDILLESAPSTYVAMTGYGTVEVSSISELAEKYVSVLPVLDPSFKFASEQYVDGLIPKINVVSFEKIDDWYCRVWSNGLKECWYSAKKYYDATGKGPSFFDSNVLNIRFPTDYFQSIPVIHVTGTGNTSSFPKTFINVLDQTGVSIAVQTDKSSNGTVILGIYCMGE